MRFALPVALSILIAACAAGPASTAAPSAALTTGRLDRGSFRSNALGRTMQYVVYLPPGYDQDPNGRYATAYVLHGGGGDINEWISYGLIDAAERMMQSREIRPFVIVMPEGDQEYWVDHVIDARTGANGEKWGTYVARDVVQTIDQRYRTIGAASGRAIGGLSTGGHGAMQLAMNFPDVWSAIAATSPALRPQSDPDPAKRTPNDAPTYLGFGADYAARDPLSLIAAKPDVARRYLWRLDAATLDPWIAQARAIHDELDHLGIPNTFQTSEGGHDAAYWSGHVTDYLRFYASALCRDAASCPYPP